jgi:hypothetical protein
MVNMLDAHCHLDLYPDPSQTALNAESSGVFVICVTNTPSAFLAARPHVRRFKKVRLALGLHPLNAELHTDDELSQFRRLVSDTSFIGEVGLDFSREGRETRNKQLNSFQFVLRCLNNEPKFVTIHSRRAESAVLELLQDEYRLRHFSKTFRTVSAPFALVTIRGIASVLNSVALTVYKIDYITVDKKPETLFMCLKQLVGERGFEPPTPWSRTRFRRLLKSVESCCF